MGCARPAFAPSPRRRATPTLRCTGSSSRRTRWRAYLFERCYLLVYERVQTAVARTEDPDARLAGVVKEWVALTDTHLDAVLFMNEGLRDFWPKVRPALKRKSLLKLLDALVPADAGVEPALGVAKIVGTLGQVARQRFFGAFPDSRKLERQLHTLLTWKRT